MKLRTPQILIGLVVIIVIAAGAYAIMNKSTQSTTPPTSSSLIQTKNSPSLGAYLADTKAKALYTYERDSSGVSNCTGSCLVNWPAYLAAGSVGSLPAHVGTIKRTDGSTQYTYNNMPLYTFIGDSQAGSVTGDGSEGFHIAKPATSATTQTTPTTQAPAPAATTPTPAPSTTPAQSSPSPKYNY
jgi:predicted lipoprotein with Yx(FWY)xxD motif